jgi:FkbM family methyltransferase
MLRWNRLINLIGNSQSIQPELKAQMADTALARVEQKLDFLIAKMDNVHRKIQEVRQLVGPFSAIFPDGSLLTQSIHGVKYFIDPDDMVIAPQMIVYRQWEADLSYIFRSICHPNSVVVDVGANFGYFSILAANLIGNLQSGQVFSFEPNPKLAALLRRNAEINWSIAPITLHDVAVTDFGGEVILYIPKGHGANASLTAPDEFECIQVKVPTVRLDDALPASIAVDILKIDVEGHELSVLKGARNVIARSPNMHLIMEWSRTQMRQAGIDTNEILALLRDFVPYRIEIGSAPLDHPECFDWLIAQDYADVLFVRQ